MVFMMNNSRFITPAEQSVEYGPLIASSILTVFSDLIVALHSFLLR